MPILDIIDLEVTGGHTEHHQVVFIQAGSSRIVFLGDAIPTSAHMKPVYVTSYDSFPVRLVEVKKDLVKRIEQENWTPVFYHDIK